MRILVGAYNNGLRKDYKNLMWKTGKRRAALSFKQMDFGSVQKIAWPNAHEALSVQTLLLVWTDYQPQGSFMLCDPAGFRADARLTL